LTPTTMNGNGHRTEEVELPRFRTPVCGACPLRKPAVVQVLIQEQAALLASVGLTPRELTVALLVAEGCSNAEIAERLTITPATSKWHVGRVMDRLGVRTRVGIGVWAAKAGLA
jgi:DNA-binding CsgD family transcriptional regulator